MIYTDLTRQAMRIAFEAHKDQVDKSGVPYIYHPVHLAEQMEGEDAVCVALLHDVVEDTSISIEELAEHGFSSPILEALMLMTHDPSIPYMDYIAAIKKHPIACAVKLADLRHNSDLSRLVTIDEDAEHRYGKYLAAIAYLEA